MSTPGGDVKRINTFLELVVNQHGSDLHLVSGQPPRIRFCWEGVCADGWREPPRLLYDTELVLTKNFT